tara:strand:- start:52 stop:627 length:576 start_codon:yes stop_codon:yes gene_type:complete
MKKMPDSKADQRKKSERRLRAEKIATERYKTKKAKLNEINLYHFTDIRNIKSIMEHGLFGWKSLEKEPFNYKREIDYFPASDIPGEGKTYGLSRWLDTTKGRSDYIRLTSNKNHPMIKEAVFRNSLNIKYIKISNKIIEDIGCSFSDMNATKTEATIDVNMSIYLESDDPQKEILVKHHIPASYIEKVEDY